MKRLSHFAIVAVAIISTAYGQPARAPEPLNFWPYFKEIRPAPAPTGYLEIVLDRETLDQCRTDAADLRLYDNAGREIPYALRVRRDVSVQDEFEGREFNRGVKDGTSQVSIDLGEQPHDHNQVLIETDGTNFRRLSDIEGSSDGSGWVTLTSRAALFRFTADGRTVEQQAISYPVSRYRFLRISVDRDPQTDKAAPEIKSVRVRRMIRLNSEYTPVMGTLEPRESDRSHGRPASVWRIDLGARVPIERLILSPNAGDYARPFELESVDDPNAPLLLASGTLAHREQPNPSPAAITFAERWARRLKLTVTDDRNEPLAISSITAMSAARQLVFEPSAARVTPLRLYYGNLKAAAPHYDLDARIPANAPAFLTRVALGPQQQNPGYRPEPKPFTEREPWVVYIVLIGACVILAWLLLNLVRASNAQSGITAPL